MKQYAWIFCSRDESTPSVDCVEEVVQITGGQFGNPEAAVCESMPLAASEWHSDGRGKAFCGVLLRLDYAQQWYGLQAAGAIKTFEIDTTRDLLVAVLDDNGDPVTIEVTVSIDEETGEPVTKEHPVMVPNEAPYKYGTAPILDFDGNDTGETQDLFMSGAGNLSPRPPKPKSQLKTWTKTITYPEVIDEQETGVTLFSTYKFTFDKATGKTTSELIDSGVYVEPEVVV